MTLTRSTGHFAKSDRLRTHLLQYSSDTSVQILRCSAVETSEPGAILSSCQCPLIMGLDVIPLTWKSSLYTANSFSQHVHGIPWEQYCTPSNQEAVYQGFRQSAPYQGSVGEVRGPGNLQHDVNHMYGINHAMHTQLQQNVNRMYNTNNAMQHTMQTVYEDPSAQPEQDFSRMYSTNHAVQTFYDDPGAHPAGTHPVLSYRTANSLAVNAQHGVILCEISTVFIRNLSFQCTTNDLRGLLARPTASIHYTLI